MYQIMKNGKAVDYAEKVIFIRMQENGSLGECDFADCTGFAANSVPYHMEGRQTTGMEDLPTASYLIVDSAKIMSEQEERIHALESAMLDILMRGASNV